MIRCLTDFCTVDILEDNRVLDIHRIIVRRISGVSCTSDYLIIPAGKLVSIRVIRRLRRSFWRSHFIAIMICCFAQLRAIIVLEDYRILNIHGIIRCRISGVAHAGNDLLIPASEIVSIRVIRRLRRSFGHDHFITVMVCRTAQLCAIVVLEDNRIFDKHGIIRCCISGVSRTSHNLVIPASEIVSIRVIRRLRRGIRRCHFISVMVCRVA